MPARPANIEFTVETFPLSNAATLAIFLERIESSNKAQALWGVDKILLFRMQLFFEGLYDIKNGAFKSGIDFELDSDEMAQLEDLLSFDAERRWSKPEPHDVQIIKVKMALDLIKSKLAPGILARVEIDKTLSGIDLAEMPISSLEIAAMMVH